MSEPSEQNDETPTTEILSCPGGPTQRSTYPRHDGVVLPVRLRQTRKLDSKGLLDGGRKGNVCRHQAGVAASARRAAAARPVPGTGSGSPFAFFRLRRELPKSQTGCARRGRQARLSQAGRQDVMRGHGERKRKRCRLGTHAPLRLMLSPCACLKMKRRTIFATFVCPRCAEGCELGVPRVARRSAGAEPTISCWSLLLTASNFDAVAALCPSRCVGASSLLAASPLQREGGKWGKG